MDKELPVSKFSVSLLEMSGGIEASALQMTRNWSQARLSPPPQCQKELDGVRYIV